MGQGPSRQGCRGFEQAAQRVASLGDQLPRGLVPAQQLHVCCLAQAPATVGAPVEPEGHTAGLSTVGQGGDELRDGAERGDLPGLAAAAAAAFLPQLLLSPPLAGRPHLLRHQLSLIVGHVCHHQAVHRRAGGAYGSHAPGHRALRGAGGQRVGQQVLGAGVRGGRQLIEDLVVLALGGPWDLHPMLRRAQRFQNP